MVKRSLIRITVTNYPRKKQAIEAAVQIAKRYIYLFMDCDCDIAPDVVGKAVQIFLLKKKILP
jgi:hypothetical protein